MLVDRVSWEFYQISEKATCKGAVPWKELTFADEIGNECNEMLVQWSFLDGSLNLLHCLLHQLLPILEGGATN